MNSEVLRFPPFEAGTKCLVMYNFKDPDENSPDFNIGDVVTVTEICQPNYRWCIVTTDDNEKNGKVPCAILTYLKKNPVKGYNYEFYHGRITREESENRLRDMEEGNYLIRESIHHAAQYVISVSAGDHVHHYRMTYSSPKSTVTIDNELYFANLESLIQFYKANPNTGIYTQLKKAIRCPEPKRKLINHKFFSEEGWLIPTEEIIHGDVVIAEGRYGDLCSGTYRGRDIAIKSGGSSSITREALLHQASILTHLSHKNIIELIGITLDDQQDISLITEMICVGSLLNYVRRWDLNDLNEDALTKFALDICSGMCYLTEQQFVHRDLALRNMVLVSSNGEKVAKISNFNFTIEANGYAFPLHHHCIKWMAPESIKEQSFTSQSDIWSFGILLWELFSYGSEPYPGRSEDSILGYIDGGYRLDRPRRCVNNTYNIMTSCWESLPDDRLTFDKVKELLLKLCTDNPQNHSTTIPESESNPDFNEIEV